MKYISFDMEGFIEGFYDKEYTNLPKDAVLLSDEDAAIALDAMNNQRKKVKVIGGKLEFTVIQKPVVTQIKELKHFLASTDWFSIRKLETGKEIPENILKQREEIREQISLLENTGKY